MMLMESGICRLQAAAAAALVTAAAALVTAAAVPEQAAAVPEQAAAVPEQAAAVPEQAAAVPEQAALVPEQAAAVAAAALASKCCECLSGSASPRPQPSHQHPLSEHLQIANGSHNSCTIAFASILGLSQCGSGKASRHPTWHFVAHLSRLT